MTGVDTVREKVIKHLIASSDWDVKPEQITNETLLREDFDLSSLQAVTLVMDLEDEFGVTIEDAEIEKLASVGEVLGLIHTKMPDAG